MSSSSPPSPSRAPKRKQFASGGSAAKRSKFASVDLTKGLRGYLITCDSGKEHLCQREVIAWLTNYADRLYPPQPQPLGGAAGEAEQGKAGKGGADDDGPAAVRASVGSALEAELAELKAQQRQPRRGGGERFAAVESTIRGVVFIHSRDEAVDHVQLLYSMLDDVTRTHRLYTRYTIRIHPLLSTCFSRLTELMALLTPILRQRTPPLPPDAPPRTFAVVFHKRGHHEQLHRAEVIEAVAKEVGSGWKVNLDEPQVVVLVEVATRMAGVGVVERWGELHKFNVRAMAEEGYKASTPAGGQEPEPTASPSANNESQAPSSTDDGAT